MIESEAAERFLGFPERLAVRLNGLLGALLDGAFAQHRRSLPAVPLPRFRKEPHMKHVRSSPCSRGRRSRRRRWPHAAAPPRSTTP